MLNGTGQREPFSPTGGAASAALLCFMNTRPNTQPEGPRLQPSLFDDGEIESWAPCRWSTERCPSLSRCPLTPRSPATCAWAHLGGEDVPQRPLVSDWTDG